jgi:hypothetical protein
MARSCADALGAAIAGGLQGLEGATTVVRETGSVPRVEIAADGLRALVPAGEPFEVEALPGGAWRAAAAVPLRVGDPIVLLPPDRPGGTVPGAVVSAVAGTDLRWTSSVASQQLQLEVTPRAVAAVQSLELAWRRTDDGVTLHRRVDGGRWQPLGTKVRGVDVGWELLPAGSPAVRVRCDAGAAAPVAERVVRAP